MRQPLVKSLAVSIGASRVLILGGSYSLLDSTKVKTDFDIYDLSQDMLINTLDQEVSGQQPPIFNKQDLTLSVFKGIKDVGQLERIELNV